LQRNSASVRLRRVHPPRNPAGCRRS
jgi:hypothetical protein